IWSSRARNRSADPVVSCFFGRIAPSDAATESCFSIRGNRENEFASFQGLRHGNLAISSQQSRQKTTLAQWVRNSSRATKQNRRGTKKPMAKRVLALDAPLTSLADDQVLSFVEWCRLNRISERNGRRILASPDGPQTVQLSQRRVGVTVRANREWQHARERG